MPPPSHGHGLICSVVILLLIPKDSNAADHASLSQVEAPGDEDHTVMRPSQAEILLENPIFRD
jgi:hypothetical protein